MPNPVSAIASAVSIGGSLLQGNAQKSAAKQAAAASQQASDESSRRLQAAADEAVRISEQRFNQGMGLLAPYLQTGTAGLNSFQALGGFYNPATGSVPMTYEEYTASYQKPQPTLVAPTPPPVPPTKQALNIHNPFNDKKYTDTSQIMFDNSLSQKQKNVLTGNAAVASGFLNSFDKRRASPQEIKSRAEAQALLSQAKTLLAGNTEGKALIEMPAQNNTNNIDDQQYQQQLAAYNQQQQQLAQQAATPQPPMMTREEFLARQQKEAYDAQQREIANIERSPLYKSLFQQAEDAVLQNASATGGLRGGYAQDKLAYLRPSMLKALIDQKTAQAQWLASQGQNAAGTGLQAGLNLANTQANILTNNATNQANILTNNATNQGNSALARGQAQSDMFGGIARGLGSLTGGTNSLFTNGGSGGGLNIGANQRNVSSYNPGSTVSGFNLGF